MLNQPIKFMHISRKSHIHEPFFAKGDNSCKKSKGELLIVYITWLSLPNLLNLGFFLFLNSLEVLWPSKQYFSHGEAGFLNSWDC